MIGWLLDTNVTAEIISPGGSTRVKGRAAGQPETTLYLSILTIAEYDKGIANLPDQDPRRLTYMNTRDGLAARFAARLLALSDAIVRRWGVITGTVRRKSGHPPPVRHDARRDRAGARPPFRDAKHARCGNAGAALFNPWEDDPAAFPTLPRPRRRPVTGP